MARGHCPALQHPPWRPPSSVPHSCRSPGATGAEPPTAFRPGTGVTLTCRTRVLRVTRSMGLYSSAAGREEESAATRRRGPGPSPTRESQHCIPRGQGGEARCPESPTGLHGALGKRLGSVLPGASNSWTITLLPRAVVSQGSMPQPRPLQGQEKPRPGWCVEQGQSPVLAAAQCAP